MKITRDKALAVTAYCRRMGLKYASEGQYPNSVKAGRRAGTKAPNGMHIHFPRDWVWMHHDTKTGTQEPALHEAHRAYVLWFGEPLPAIEEACAYILMISRDKEICVVRCSNASIATKEVESIHELETKP
jgi:hypothetical protein